MSAIYLGYMLIINLITGLLFTLDKSKARKNKWRLSELSLLGFCAAGGCFGGAFAMLLCRHKTRTLKFRILVPFFCLLHAFIAYYIIIEFAHQF